MAHKLLLNNLLCFFTQKSKYAIEAIEPFLNGIALAFLYQQMLHGVQKRIMIYSYGDDQSKHVRSNQWQHDAKLITSCRNNNNNMKAKCCLT